MSVRLCVVSIRDSAVDAFQNPFFAPTTGAAIRAFRDEVVRSGSEMGKHPSDYILYHIADWDVDTGEFHSLGTPSQLVRGVDCQE